MSDYSFATMLSLEDRIKMELKALGLFDPEENPLNPAQEKEEDNEVSNLVFLILRFTLLFS